jgi:hypothetical protein
LLAFFDIFGIFRIYRRNGPTASVEARERFMLSYLVAAIIVIGLPTLYVAVRYREYRKFLAGAFFVSSGMQFYFYLAKLQSEWRCDQPMRSGGSRYDRSTAISRADVADRIVMALTQPETIGRTVGLAN